MIKLLHRLDLRIEFDVVLCINLIWTSGFDSAESPIFFNPEVGFASPKLPVVFIILHIHKACSFPCDLWFPWFANRYVPTTMFISVRVRTELNLSYLASL